MKLSTKMIFGWFMKSNHKRERNKFVLPIVVNENLANCHKFMNINNLNYSKGIK